jgi:hypothetical protein
LKLRKEPLKMPRIQQQNSTSVPSVTNVIVTNDSPVEGLPITTQLNQQVNMPGYELLLPAQYQGSGPTYTNTPASGMGPWTVDARSPSQLTGRVTELTINLEDGLYGVPPAYPNLKIDSD